MTEPAIYVYAVVEHGRKPRVPRRGGVPGAGAPRAVPLYARRWAIVADVSAADFAPDAVRARLADLEWVGACALGHERVVEALLGSTAVAPMRLFAVFRDEATLLAKLRRAKTRLDRTLSAVRGRLECAVRVWPARPARETAVEPLTGTAFLASRAARVRSGVAVTRGQAKHAAALLRELAAIADRTRTRSTRAAESQDATSRQFLVARHNLRAFGATVTRGRRELRPLGLEVALLGPYPAYSFV